MGWRMPLPVLPLPPPPRTLPCAAVSSCGQVLGLGRMPTGLPGPEHAAAPLGSLPTKVPGPASAARRRWRRRRVLPPHSPTTH